MKKVFAILMVLLMLVALAGCNIKQKIGEKIAEGILEQSGAGDVDIDGDSMTVTGEDGEEMTIGGTEWPDSDLAKLIPEFTKGTVSYVMQSEGYLYITVDEVAQDDAKAYVDSIKNDFTVDSYDMSYEGGFSYSAKNADNISISVSFSDATLLIMVSQEAQ